MVEMAQSLKRKAQQQQQRPSKPGKQKQIEEGVRAMAEGGNLKKRKKAEAEDGNIEAADGLHTASKEKKKKKKKKGDT